VAKVTAAGGLADGVAFASASVRTTVELPAVVGNVCADFVTTASAKTLRRRRQRKTQAARRRSKNK
jgi:hypothetical protein